MVSIFFPHNEEYVSYFENFINKICLLENLEFVVKLRTRKARDTSSLKAGMARDMWDTRALRARDT